LTIPRGSIMPFVRQTAVLLLLLTLSGCVWLRMLEMKSQLANFDENFTTETTDHFILHFLHPVLYSEDYVTLAKVHPSVKQPLPKGNRWRQVFHKVDGKGQIKTGADVIFTFDFNQDDKLAAWDFSPTFLAMIPPQFLEASLRSLGKGKVDEARKQLRVKPEDLPKISSKPPTVKEIQAVLGEPPETGEEDGLKLHVYKFKTDTLYVLSEYEERRSAYAKLYYDPKTDELQKVMARFLGLKFSVDFRNLIQLQAVGKGS
jgi:hypothetical protein